ncbi:MAG: hypothetical protein A2172_00965 [Candidatus Woykebacteria bacterium RBG_13_40_15]|uniref:Uncharacterized protein n=1 Tax=Candidatus Woykebacteria bacterium RBG_13_40_15 TaxID=1802593 RepID=A0A1G1W8U1_9BACT|nr:MAG: hypothetical protein A2172_00965 [Candidatus Woykebacteria bacterium RBG_13_40_15]
MTARLVKGVYGTYLAPFEGPFGLRYGQRRKWYIHNNAGWYNSEGEKLGWGDLNIEDIQRIASELLPGEVFIILSEQDTSWQHDRMDAPGIEYCAFKCHCIILPGKVYKVVGHEYETADEDVEDQGLAVTLVSRSRARELLSQPTNA